MDVPSHTVYRRCSMKRRNTHRRIKKSRRIVYGPSGYAWIALAIAWLSILPIAARLFRPHIADALTTENDPVPVMSVSVPDAFESRSVAKTELQILPSIGSLRANEPTILIYHTHTTEAYTQTETETYQESSGWRTFDAEKNVVAVGEELKRILETDYGFRVIHDKTNHEPPKLATSYERSLLTMEKYHKDYPSIVLFIDLHRDAYDTSNAPCDFLTVNGTETARMMLVVGKGEKYSDKPYYDSNIVLAKRITDHLNSIAPKLARPIREKTGRYNQHVAPNCILVEVGHNANTLSQAKAAMQYLAESIAYAFQPEEMDVSVWSPI